MVMIGIGIIHRNNTFFHFQNMKSTLNYRAKNLQYQIEHVHRCPLNKLFLLVVIVVLATTLHSLTHSSWLTKTVTSKNYLEKVETIIHSVHLILIFHSVFYQSLKGRPPLDGALEANKRSIVM